MLSQYSDLDREASYLLHLSFHSLEASRIDDEGAATIGEALMCNFTLIELK